jgi:hypothetical protein
MRISMNKNWIILATLVLVVAGVFVMRGNDEKADVSLDGIHIMENGMVMLGNGEMVEGAIVTDDGKIMLKNGDIVLPMMDLRKGADMMMDDEGMMGGIDMMDMEEGGNDAMDGMDVMPDMEM